ncbi:MAG: RdgB/HAM1 family non-canonical purine NTP pyrophosphatase [Bacilli bacterium]
MKKKLIIATHNPNKVKEYRSLFASTEYEIISLSDLNFHDDIIENGETFADNAIIKATTIHERFNLPVIADDSGLSITALDGFPGVQSARFMDGEPYTAKNQAIIEKLIDHSDRSAKFVAAIALVGVDLFPQVFIGEVKGTILTEQRGNDGFGYDPIFFYPDFQKTFAELTMTEKEKISHRGKATDLLLNYLKDHPF